MEIASQERVQALRRTGHVRVGRRRRIVPFIVFPAQRGQLGMDVVARRGLGASASIASAGRLRCRRRTPRLLLLIGRVERQRWRPVERMTEQHEAVEEVGPRERTHGGRHGAAVMADDAAHGTVAQRMHEHDHVPYERGQRESGQVDGGEVPRVPAGGAPEAALVRGHDIVAGRGQRGDHLAPGVGEFWEAVQQQQKGAIARRGETGFEDVEVESGGGDGASGDGRGEGHVDDVDLGMDLRDIVLGD